mmetsp:Transcript_38199/g.60459  ORF Transcript_38199/g.60459 Transcript_38199/m.60459 type:complete len:321 (-) Transcript_38199:184-1146(-)|eukprot:CAMPEP_0201542888 /NCGR_PEP_ID=MMETSP0161_2-20130828/72272_1 /ASSEMBLY_ACC=CAM_ASM_000251 /TAXON_ID=180227 /ORGANISM="Neoparamoeba aestuarina, Strain SoJaBio B1-5/56/2" /LENGTH=320 /DNA_ID=CAMNT_0047950577 /DNA_START=61 /DNA_END=1023 /DNA_ORIENTATION=-
MWLGHNDFLLGYGSDEGDDYESRSSSPPPLAPKKTADVSSQVQFSKDPSKTLGKGAHGTVYKGRLLREKEVAVKILKHSYNSTEKFHREIEVMEAFSHDVGFLSLLGVIRRSENNEMGLVTELMRNGDLVSFLRSPSSSSSSSSLPRKSISTSDRFLLALDICSAVERLHAKGYVHGDLSSANVLITDDETAVLCDFGLTSKYPGRNFGNKLYAAPEYFHGRFNTSKSDIYSLGMILYEIFLLKPAFSQGAARFLRQKENLLRHRKSPLMMLDFAPIPPLLRPLLEACLSTNPDKRPSSAILCNQLRESIRRTNKSPRNI